jgi:hypothetical protein
MQRREQVVREAEERTGEEPHHLSTAARASRKVGQRLPLAAQPPIKRVASVHPLGYHGTVPAFGGRAAAEAAVLMLR